MSPDQVAEPVTGSLDDELDQFAAVFTILGSLHYQSLTLITSVSCCR